MAWVKVPPENHAPFVAALPTDPRVELVKMFGGLAAKVNGHIFAGLFGLSAIVDLDEPTKAQALALPGADYFDPMGDGRRRSDKVMLPVAFMRDPAKLRAWFAKAHAYVTSLPEKGAKTSAARRSGPKAAATKKEPAKVAAPAKAKPKKAATKKRKVARGT
jgi:hypothetical protein